MRHNEFALPHHRVAQCASAEVVCGRQMLSLLVLCVCTAVHATLRYTEKEKKKSSVTIKRNKHYPGQSVQRSNNRTVLEGTTKVQGAV